MCLEMTSALRAAARTRLDIRGRKSMSLCKRATRRTTNFTGFGKPGRGMSPSSAIDDTATKTGVLPAVGTRLALSGYIGTIRYVGEVDGAGGIWLGVEWDDRSRGKHDGIKDGKRYFSCL
jgi:hypothetical protein